MSTSMPAGLYSGSNNKAIAYQRFIQKLSSKDPKFQPLTAFISAPPTAESRIHLVTFCPNITLNHNTAQSIQIKEADLDKQLQKGVDQELYIVEDLSPATLTILGGHCNVDAEFFLDYLDTILRSPSTPPGSRDTHYGTVTLPWYRLGDIENHLPALRSIQKTSKHVQIRFIGPREYHPDNTASPSQTVNVIERLDSTAAQTNIERIAGGHNPMHVKNQILWPIAMSRHSAAVWFDAGTKWRKAIVLLDPPFEYLQDGLQRQSSKYRSFSSHSDPDSPFALQVDKREMYTTSLIHYLKRNPNIRSKQPSPVTIVQGLYRIITSEWITVNAYLERDLNVIEWRLEREAPDIGTLNDFLKQLFIMRRRIRKYESLIEDHTHPTLPSAWLDPNTSVSYIAPEQAIASDAQQALGLIRRNSERISQTVSLITSLMSVIESNRATSLNQRLTFLTILATIALPFNVFAAIFGMQTEYAPGKSKSAVFWGSAGVTVAVVLVCYAGLLVLPSFKERFEKWHWR